MNMLNSVTVSGDVIFTQIINYNVFANHFFNLEEKNFISKMKESEFLHFAKEKGWDVRKKEFPSTYN